MAEFGRSYLSPGSNIGTRSTLRFPELQLWRAVNPGAVRSTEKQPSANAERRVENRKREQKMRKNSNDGQGYEHQGYEHHSVQYASGDDPSAASNSELLPTLLAGYALSAGLRRQSQGTKAASLLAPRTKRNCVSMKTAGSVGRARSLMAVAEFPKAFLRTMRGKPERRAVG